MKGMKICKMRKTSSREERREGGSGRTMRPKSGQRRLGIGGKAARKSTKRTGTNWKSWNWEASA